MVVSQEGRNQAQGNSYSDKLLDYPAYELYTDELRAGLFPDQPGCHLRLVLGRDRKVQQVETI